MIADRQRAIAAATQVAAAAGLVVHDAIVLQASNKLVVRLLPCDVLARIGEPLSRATAELEVELALRLAETEAPTGRLAPRPAPRAHAPDGFVVTFWTFCENAAAPAAAAYARALETLHACMRRIDMPSPHFTSRIEEALGLVESREATPALADADRALLIETLRTLRRSLTGRGLPEQLLHGEPHPGNLLWTRSGPLFIDLETCCRGPIEFDLAHAPQAVGALYPGADPQTLHACRLLMLAMVAAWRWDRNDRLPNGAQRGREYLSALRLALAGGSVLCPDIPEMET